MRTIEDVEHMQLVATLTAAFVARGEATPAACVEAARVAALLLIDGVMADRLP